MSANKFKIGDKVRVRKGLVIDKYYDGVRCNDSMAKLGGKLFTIKYVGDNSYSVDGYIFCWSDEMLEPAYKTLDDLCAGDCIKSGSSIRKILAAVDGCYLLSYLKTYDVADKWYTAEQLKVDGFELFDPQTKTIEIDGKTYDEAEVKKAVQDLEPSE